MCTAVPVILNSFLPDIIFYGISYGTNRFVPVGWIKTGVQTVLGVGGMIGNVMLGVFIGNKLFPALDQYNSGIGQLRKFFKNDRIRSHIKRGDLFPSINMLSFLCVVLGNYCLSCNHLFLKAVGGVSHAARLILNYMLYCDLQYENPINREAHNVRGETSYGQPYVLRDMKED